MKLVKSQVWGAPWADVNVNVVNRGARDYIRNAVWWKTAIPFRQVVAFQFFTPITNKVREKQDARNPF